MKLNVTNVVFNVLKITVVAIDAMIVILIDVNNAKIII